MPVASLTEGRDLILTHFKTAWDAGSAAISGSVPTVLYRDVKTDGPPESAATFVRITVQHNERPQVTLQGEAGQRRFRQDGIVTVQIFTTAGEGQDESDALAQLVVDTFALAPAGDCDEITFRNVRANEIGEDGDWFQINVLAEFDYDMIQ